MTRRRGKKLLGARQRRRQWHQTTHTHTHTGWNNATAHKWLINLLYCSKTKQKKKKKEESVVDDIVIWWRWDRMHATPQTNFTYAKSNGGPYRTHITFLGGWSAGGLATAATHPCYKVAIRAIAASHSHIGNRSLRTKVVGVLCVYGRAIIRVSHIISLRCKSRMNWIYECGWLLTLSRTRYICMLFYWLERLY